MKLTRREMLAYSAMAGGLSVTGTSAFGAETFSHALSVLLASSPGGGFDQAFRGVAPEWERRLKQPIRPVYVPGPGNVLVATRTIGAPPDGSTMAMIGFATNDVAIQFLKPPNYSFGEFAYIGTAYAGPLAFFVGKNSPIKNIQELVEASKHRKVTAGISGAREIYHVGGLMFNRAVGAKIEYIPYNGGAPSRLAAASGETDLVMSGLFDASTNYDLLRCVCVFGPENPIPKIMPGPTMHELFGKAAIDIWHPVGFATSSKAKKANPAAYKLLVDTYREAYEASRPALVKIGFPEQALVYWSPEKISDWERGFLAGIKDIVI
jgi:tripartite-type tricarboxylate transporter receptor subunit TctC